MIGHPYSIGPDEELVDCSRGFRKYTNHSANEKAVVKIKKEMEKAARTCFMERKVTVKCLNAERVEKMKVAPKCKRL